MDSRTKRTIGKRLRKKREECGYTREKMGELCNLSPRFIANVELGESTFSLDSIITVCNILSCSSDYLLFGIENNDDEWSNVIAKLHHLSPHYKEQITQLLQSMIEIIAKAEQTANMSPID